MQTTKPHLRALGDVLGPLHYLGRCPVCGRQHMSTHDRVLVTARGRLCVACAAKEGR